MGMSLSPQEIMRMDSLYDYLDTVDEGHSPHPKGSTKYKKHIQIISEILFESCSFYELKSLDEDSIFYLMSRGLDQKTAKELLINGFLLDVVEKITDEEIKKLIQNMIGLN